MLIYIIEDDPLKAESLKQFISEENPGTSIDIHGSYNTGLYAIRSRPPDLIVLDMTLPTYDRGPARRAGRLRPLGGYDLLRKLLLSQISVPSIVVTMLETFGEGDSEVSLEDMTKRCKAEFSGTFLGSVHFQLVTTAWQSELKCVMNTFLEK